MCFQAHRRQRPVRRLIVTMWRLLQSEHEQFPILNGKFRHLNLAEKDKNNNNVSLFESIISFFIVKL